MNINVSQVALTNSTQILSSNSESIPSTIKSLDQMEQFGFTLLAIFYSISILGIGPFVLYHRIRQASPGARQVTKKVITIWVAVLAISVILFVVGYNTWKEFADNVKNSHLANGIVVSDTISIETREYIQLCELKTTKYACSYYLITESNTTETTTTETTTTETTTTGTTTTDLTTTDLTTTGLTTTDLTTTDLTTTDLTTTDLTTTDLTTTDLTTTDLTTTDLTTTNPTTTNPTNPTTILSQIILISENETTLPSCLVGSMCILPNTNKMCKFLSCVVNMSHVVTEQTLYQLIEPNSNVTILREITRFENWTEYPVSFLNETFVRFSLWDLSQRVDVNDYSDQIKWSLLIGPIILFIWIFMPFGVLMFECMGKLPCCTIICPAIISCMEGIGTCLLFIPNCFIHVWICLRTSIWYIWICFGTSLWYIWTCLVHIWWACWSLCVMCAGCCSYWTNMCGKCSRSICNLCVNRNDVTISAPTQNFPSPSSIWHEVYQTQISSWRDRSQSSRQTVSSFSLASVRMEDPFSVRFE
jgi:hypothetical protein